MTHCELCEKSTVDDGSNHICSDPQQHQARSNVNDLLKILKVCDVAEKSSVIDQIKVIEESANIDSLYRVDFTNNKTLAKFNIPIPEPIVEPVIEPIVEQNQETSDIQTSEESN